MLEIRDGLVRRVPRPRLPAQEAATFQGYPPDALLAAYGFPEGFDGSGVTIGIAEWSSGYNPADIADFCDLFGLPPCDLTFVSVDGSQNDDGTSGVDEEATLDIEWVHAGAPGAKKRLYYASSGTSMADFGQQVHLLFQFVLQDPDRPQILTVSYGDAEATFGKDACVLWQADIAALQAAGTWVFVSSGDQGALGMHDIYANPSGQRNVDAPASCPAAIGVGGTRLVLTPTLHESVWNDSGMGADGGGISSIWARPAYQNGHMAYGRRGVPDLAANADPVTGYAVVFQGTRQVIGGTSASAPFVAGLFARILQAMAEAGVTPPKDPHDVIYGNPQAFRDITQGNNSFMGVQGYTAGPGWDACTGMGVPIGTALLAAFVPQQEAPAPEPVKPEPVEPAPAPAPTEPAASDPTATIPVYINGVQIVGWGAYSGLISGTCLVPATLTGEALGWQATRNADGVWYSQIQPTSDEPVQDETSEEEKTDAPAPEEAPAADAQPVEEVTTAEEQPDPWWKRPFGGAI